MSIGCGEWPSRYRFRQLLSQWNSRRGQVTSIPLFTTTGEGPNSYVLSWNKDLARQRANAMAGEFRTKGVNVALGPVVGPSGRIAEGGRNWEGDISSFHG